MLSVQGIKTQGEDVSVAGFFFFLTCEATAVPHASLCTGKSHTTELWGVWCEQRLGLGPTQRMSVREGRTAGAACDPPPSGSSVRAPPSPRESRTWATAFLLFCILHT